MDEVAGSRFAVFRAFFKEKIQNTLIYFIKNVTLHFIREMSRMMKTNVFFAKNNLVSVRFSMETFDW